MLYGFTLFILAIDQMRVVLEELRRIAQWKEFGRNLGIDEERLDEIEVDNSHTHRRLSKVIQHWLKRNHNEIECGPPTWGNLANAIKPIDMALAMKIESKHAVCHGKEHNAPNGVIHNRHYTKFALSWGIPKPTYNARTVHGTATKPGRSTVLQMPVRNLEDHGCKPTVTKLASVLHTRLRAPQLCSLCINEFHRNCHMISWRDT